MNNVNTNNFLKIIARSINLKRKTRPCFKVNKAYSNFDVPTKQMVYVHFIFSAQVSLFFKII